MQVKYSNIGTEPITTNEVKNYLKIDFTTDDTLISDLITGVREAIEEFTGLALVVKTITYFDEDIEDEIILPYPEHDEITEVKFNGTVSTEYTKTGLSQFIIKPTISLIDVTGTLQNAGVEITYTTLGTCPKAIKLEMLRLLAEKYERRGNTFEGAIADLTENSYANLMPFVQA